MKKESLFSKIKRFLRLEKKTTMPLEIRDDQGRLIEIIQVPKKYFTIKTERKIVKTGIFTQEIQYLTPKQSIEIPEEVMTRINKAIENSKKKVKS